jgi:hypothetical protein
LSERNDWRNIAVLFRYWLKGRVSWVTLIWILFGEGFAVAMVAIVGGSFISFSAGYGLGGGFSGFALDILFAFVLIGLLQSGFSGSGLPVTSADVDYVFTSPVKPRDIFAAKVLLNSLTTVIFSFPPMLVLYLMLSRFYGAPPSTAVLAGLVTLVFLVLALILSADVTVSLGSSVGPRLRPLRNSLIVLVAVVSILPVALLIPGAPASLGLVSQVLPSGLTAAICLALVSGMPWSLGMAVDIALLVAWFAGLLLLGVRMTRGHFYEVLQITDAGSEEITGGGRAATVLETAGKSVWSVVRTKEGILMKRSKERRGLMISALFLSGFMIIYSLAGSFQSSPTSFLFVLFLIGSFGSGTANGWLEKERLWIIKTSSLDLNRYVRAVYRARVTPLLLILTPVTIAVGIPLVIRRASQPGPLLGVAMALPVALEIAAVMMGGGMYFAARWGQSTTDEILTSQAQQVTDVKRFLYQTVVNLFLVSPLMGLVLGAEFRVSPLNLIPTAPLTVILLGVSLAYSFGILAKLLDAAADSLGKREDL